MSQAEKSIAETMDIDVVKGTEKELEKNCIIVPVSVTFTVHDSYSCNGSRGESSTDGSKIMYGNWLYARVYGFGI